MKKLKTRDLVTLALLAAMAYIVAAVCHFLPIPPIGNFLKFDAKDVVVAITGFLFGPAPAFCVTVVVSVIEMVTISSTGWIGCVMNIVQTCAFVLPAAVLYAWNRRLKNAVIGLIAGVICMTAMMIAWNYILTPIYMGYPRAAVAAMLVPVFLPFNLLKGTLNAGITMLLYKPVSVALHRAHLMPEQKTAKGSSFNWKVIVVSLFVIATAVACFLLLSRS